MVSLRGVFLGKTLILFWGNKLSVAPCGCCKGKQTTCPLLNHMKDFKDEDKVNVFENAHLAFSTLFFFSLIII